MPSSGPMPSPGLIRFDDWVQHCLYGPAGFYRRGGAAGRRRGDFITSPEVGPLFGAVVARWLDDTWRSLGAPAPYVVAEVGAGRGALRLAVDAASPACAGALEYHCVEISPAIGGDDSTREPPDRAHVILANELLDNLPFRILERIHVGAGGWAADRWAPDGWAADRWAPDGWAPDGWAEVFVDPRTSPPSFCLARVAPAGDSRETERVGVGTGVSGAGVSGAGGSGARGIEVLATLEDVPVGSRVPWLERATDWVADARSRADRVLVFDYGVERTADLVGRDWLRTYRAHAGDTDPLVDPGRRDITTDVAFDQLPGGARIVRQDEWLAAWGIVELVEEGRRIWTERAHVGDLAAVRGRSRIREAEALCDPSGLGGFLVAEWES